MAERKKLQKNIYTCIFIWISKRAIMTYVLRNGHRMTYASDHGIVVNRIRHESFWGSGNVNVVSLGLSVHYMMCLLCDNASSYTIYYMYNFLYVHLTSMYI